MSEVASGISRICNFKDADDDQHKSQETIAHKPIANKSWIGYLLAVTGSLCQAFAGICLKLASNSNRTHMMVLRSIMQYLFLLPILTYKQINVVGPNFKAVGLLLIQGTFGSLATFVYIISLETLSLGDSLAIIYTFPAMVGLFACICLKEKCDVSTGIFTLGAFVGLVFVAEPSFLFAKSSTPSQSSSSGRVIGIMLSFISALLLALNAISLRKLGPGIHFSQSMLYYAVMGLFVVIISILITGESFIPCSQDLFVLSLSGFLLTLNQIFLTLALQRERAGPISSVKTTQVVFAFILQYFILDVVPTVYSCIGATLIVICAIGQALHATYKSTCTLHKPCV